MTDLCWRCVDETSFFIGAFCPLFKSLIYIAYKILQLLFHLVTLLCASWAASQLAEIYCFAWPVWDFRVHPVMFIVLRLNFSLEIPSIILYFSSSILFNSFFSQLDLHSFKWNFFKFLLWGRLYFHSVFLLTPISSSIFACHICVLSSQK